MSQLQAQLDPGLTQRHRDSDCLSDSAFLCTGSTHRQTAGLGGTVAGCQRVCTYVLFFQRLLFPVDSSKAPKLQLLINWALFPSLHHSLCWVDISAVDQSLGQSIRVKHFEKGTLQGHQGARCQKGEWMPAGKPTDILPGLQAS